MNSQLSIPIQTHCHGQQHHHHRSVASTSDKLGQTTENMNMEDMGFDNLINLIRPEDNSYPIYGNWDHRQNHLVPNYQEAPFMDFNSCTTSNFESPSPPTGGSRESIDHLLEGLSAVARTGNGSTKKAGGSVNRSRTLVSEQRRRDRMKEKLYALRALVPNITKMDKASIIRDAVLYVQDMQSEAKKLRAEIANLEASAKAMDISRGPIHHQHSSIKNPVDRSSLVTPRRLIMQIDVFQVEDRGFYSRVVSSSKGRGVAASLYRALGSLRDFDVQSSNLTMASDSFIFTCAFRVAEQRQEVTDILEVKMRVAGALLSHGFEFSTV